MIEISFVVPAFNEERYIGDCIDNIKKYAPVDSKTEIIVVDHGSTDKTREIAQARGSIVIEVGKGTVGALRNIGAKVAKGKILIFLDADVMLTAQWSESFDSKFRQDILEQRIVSGAWVGISRKPSWIERYWFAPLVGKQNTHINSGHLVVSKRLFEELGGFREDLETGEDYEFSMRAKQRGAQVKENPTLVVFHEGYPKSISQFFFREFWHGKGDARNIFCILKSKVAIASLTHVMLHAMFIFGVRPRIAGVLICMLMTMASYKKYQGKRPKIILINIFLYYIFFWARGISTIYYFLRPSVRKHKRHS